jgi:single-strand DNA-binding protein
LRYTPSGKAALAFSVVVADAKGVEKGEEAMWIRCTAWEATAEALQDRLQKGAEVYVEGKLKPSKWQTAEGETRFGLNCSAWKVEPLGQIGHKVPPRKQDAERRPQRPQEPPTGNLDWPGAA